MIDFFSEHYFQVGTVLLFSIGFMTLLLNDNLIRKIIGLNIMDTSIFQFFVSIGYAKGREAPILNDPVKAVSAYVTPVPTGLMLTGIVVAVSITAFALALIIKYNEHFGTIDLSEVSNKQRTDN